MLLTKKITMNWNPKNRKWYESKGYVFTKWRDEFEIDIKDLPDGSNVYVDIMCDHCKKILENQKWQNYKKSVKENDLYYCHSCIGKLFRKEIRKKIVINNEKTFYDWCHKNNRIDLLDRWNYELNTVEPNEISYGSKELCWFNCPRGIHKPEQTVINYITNERKQEEVTCRACNSFKQWCLDNLTEEESLEVLSRWDYEMNSVAPEDISYASQGFNKKGYWFKCLEHPEHGSELKNVIGFVTRRNNNLKCEKCNSFAYWGITNICKDFLEKYWSEQNTVDPWKISKASNATIWIKCQFKEYHGSYQTKCSAFYRGDRCPYCTHRGGKVHTLDSLGSLFEKSLETWSDKNEKTPYDYAPNSNEMAWWKCPNNAHSDFKRRISESKQREFRCPQCSFSRGETFIEECFKKNNVFFIPQKEFNGLVGIGNRNLSYDFYLPQLNLLIEYQGEFHDGNVRYKMSKKEKYRREEHDRRKRNYAKENKIKLLEIWYWDYDNIETILINNKIIQ